MSKKYCVTRTLALSLLLLGSPLYAQSTNYTDQHHQTHTLQKLNLPGKDPTMTFYQKEDGSHVALKKRFFIKIKTGVVIKKLLQKYSLHLLKQYTDESFLVRSSAPDLLELINRLHEDDDTLYAYPDFYKKVQPR